MSETQTQTQTPQEREVFQLAGVTYFKDTVPPEAATIFGQIEYIDGRITEVDSTKIIYELAKGNLIKELLELKDKFEEVPQELLEAQEAQEGK